MAAQTGLCQRDLIYGVVFDIFQDFIQLIDKLEGACIRFVHFSQENEVRSRVGTRILAKEQLWNIFAKICHIFIKKKKKPVWQVMTSI